MKPSTTVALIIDSYKTRNPNHSEQATYQRPQQLSAFGAADRSIVLSALGRTAYEVVTTGTKIP